MYCKQLEMPAPLQVAEQEKELDAAYDSMEAELRKVPCKNWHKVGPFDKSAPPQSAPLCTSLLLHDAGPFYDHHKHTRDMVRFTVYPAIALHNDMSFQPDSQETSACRSVMTGGRRTTATATRASCGTPAGRPAAPASGQTCRSAHTPVLRPCQSKSGAIALQRAISAIMLLLTAAHGDFICSSLQMLDWCWAGQVAWRAERQ